jgi:hypothetical protein
MRIRNPDALLGRGCRVGALDVADGSARPVVSRCGPRGGLGASDGAGQGIDFGLQHLHPLTEGGFDDYGILGR